MTSAIPVQRTTNWAIKPTGSWSLCEFVTYLLRWRNESEYMKIHIFELRKKQWLNEWSSQLYTQLKQLRKESLKKISGLNGIRTHDLCDTSAAHYQLSYQANWELVIVWIRYIPAEVKKWKWIYENSYIWTAEETMNKWMIIAVIYAT